MTKEKQQSIVPEAQDFVAEVDKRMKADPEFARSPYGHAAGGLAFILHVNTFSEDPEESARMQRAGMINKAQRLLDQFGPDIIQYLKDDLKLVIDEEQLTSNR